MHVDRRGLRCYTSMGDIRQHLRNLEKRDGWRIQYEKDAEGDEVGVRGWPPAPTEKPKAQPKAKAAAAKPKPKAAKKNGKAVGRKTRAVVKEQRQQVEPVHPTDAEMKCDERDVPPTGQDQVA